MRKIITLFVLAFGSTQAIAQQDPQFSQYMNNKLFMNPAYAGMRQALCFSGIYRNQWNSFEGAPNSGVFSADVFLPEDAGGIGFNLMYDKLGFENNLSFRGSYSYHVDVSRHGKLGIGVELGGFSKRIGPTGSDQWLSSTSWQSDPGIPPQIKKTVLDMGFGLWYQDQRTWFGISASHLNAQTINDGTAIVNATTHNLLFRMARHYFITGGTKLAASPAWDIKPSFLIKSDATITAVDINVTAVYNDQFWFGASYRVNDAIIPMAGFLIRGTSSNDDLGLKVGFAYDYTISKLKNYSNGSFEIFLNYCMPFKWPDGGGYDVRLGK